ncbi:MAG: hypothetical protein AAF645_17890 [Myxococcota bacterium]
MELAPPTSPLPHFNPVKIDEPRSHTPSTGTPGKWHSGDLTRGLGVAAVPVLLLWALVQSHRSTYGHVTATAWALGAAFVVLFGALAVRIWMRDARPPEGSTHVFRTRDLSVFAEAVMAGMGALLFTLGAFSIVDVWIEAPGTKTPLVAFFVWPMALPLLFWRPTFFLDARRRILKRFAFGQALPLRTKTLPYEVELVVEKCWRGRQVRRVIGHMLRGKTNAGTFELEFFPVGTPTHVVLQRIEFWKQTIPTF